LKIFGCLTYVQTQSREWLKFDPKSRKYIFLSLETSVKSYMLWDLVSNKKIISREVVFNEAYMLGKGKDEASINKHKGNK
jgi:hypothetical protein